MIYICNDKNKSKWYYDDSTTLYHRIYSDGKKYENTRIFGKYLPDPEEILNKKIQEASLKKGRVDIEKLKPTKAVYALFEHWKNLNC